MTDYHRGSHAGRNSDTQSYPDSFSSHRDWRTTREENDKSNRRERDDDMRPSADPMSRNRRKDRSRSPYTDKRQNRRSQESASGLPTYKVDKSQNYRSRRRSVSGSLSPQRRYLDSPHRHNRTYRRRSTSSSAASSSRRYQRNSRSAARESNRRHESFSPPPKRRRRSPQDDSRQITHHRNASLSPRRSPPPQIRSKAPLPSQEQAYNKDPSSTTVIKLDEHEKQEPNYAPTGKLAAETNTVAGTSIILKYNEPPEARLPPSSAPWRLYVFKGKDLLETIPLSTRSCWLFGRERAVVDFPTEHPSCSKQHAVLQFRHVEKKNEYGDKVGGVKPYIIDLDSANGTKLNGEKLEGRRYVAVMSGDVVTFGDSTREYVVMLPPKD